MWQWKFRNAEQIMFAGIRGDWRGFLHTSSAGVRVWSSVWNSVLFLRHSDIMAKHNVDIVGVQWQRHIQYHDPGVCIWLQVSSLYWRWLYLPTKGTFCLHVYTIRRPACFSISASLETIVLPSSICVFVIEAQHNVWKQTYCDIRLI